MYWIFRIPFYFFNVGLIFFMFQPFLMIVWGRTILCFLFFNLTFIVRKYIRVFMSSAYEQTLSALFAANSAEKPCGKISRRSISVKLIAMERIWQSGFKPTMLTCFKVNLTTQGVTILIASGVKVTEMGAFLYLQSKNFETNSLILKCS